MKTWGCFQEFGKQPSFSEIQNGMHSSRSRAIHGAPVPHKVPKRCVQNCEKAAAQFVLSRAHQRHTGTQTETARTETQRETMVPHPCGVKQTQISNPALTCETGSQCQNPPYCVKRTRMCKVQTSRETESRDQNLAVLCETNLHVQTGHVRSKKDLEFRTRLCCVKQHPDIKTGPCCVKRVPAIKTSLCCVKSDRAQRPNLCSRG